MKTPLTVRQAARLVWDLARSVRFLAVASVAANLIAAVFEGSTIGIMIVALQVLGGPETSLGATFGGLGRWLDGIRLAVGPQGLFLGLVGSAMVAQILRSGLQFAGQVATVQVGMCVQTEAHRQMFERIMRMSFSRASRYPLGELTDYLGQAGILHSVLIHLNLVVRSALQVASYGLALCWLSWPTALVMLPGYWVVSRCLRRVIETVGRHSSRLTASAVALSQRTAEFLQALRLIHSFARQEEAVQTVGALTREGMGSYRRAMIWSSAVEPTIDILTVVGAGALLVGGYVVLAPRGLATLPYLLAILVALHRMTPRLSAVHNGLTELAICRPRLARIAEILAVEDRPEREPPRPGRPFSGFARAIEFRRVTLQYRPEERPAVRELSMVIPRGSFTALVGISGAGKSSIADLLLRLYEPTSGDILIDGMDLRAFEVGSWRERVGVVSQDVFLFHASIRENIAFGRPTATTEEIATAARAAHADEFIARLAEGYETIVGDRGYRLSGGERQRIALARALIRQPELLLLDEAMSALDSESERFVRRAIDEQRGSRTILLISHRLSTVARADQILVLEAGRLIEHGSHEALLAGNGLYARLWRLQSQGRETQHRMLLEGAVP